ncbi:MAG: S8 family serine peptidase [Nanoarchaeota archaeon]
MKKNKILFLIFIIFAFSLILAGGISNANIKVNSDVYSKIQEESKIKVFIKIKSPPISLLSSAKTIAEKKKLVKERIANLVGKDNVKHQFKEGVSAFITESDLKELEKDSNVEKISLVGTKQLFLQQSTSIINATLTWPKQLSGINLTGAGQTICIIDSGINYSHSSFGGCYGNNNLSSSCKVLGGIDYCADNTDCTTSDDDPMDVNGHGTHVAGIAAANGSITGVAPEAKIIIIKATNASGILQDDDVRAGIDWCIQNSSIFNISVISMSFGGGLYNSYCDNQDDYSDITGAINAAVAKNISVVIATGNDNNYTSISSPACIRNATRVSATAKSDVIDTNYANRNSIVLLLAPGTDITSTCISGSSCSKTGTSMATPHVSGAIALVNQFLQLTNQVKTPRQIEIILNNTGKRISDNGNSNLNFSRINIYNAIISLDNQPPNVSLLSPANNSISLNINQTFRCNASDFSLKNATFFLWNSTAVYNQSFQNASSSSNNFEINISNLPIDNYQWNCLYADENNNKAFALLNNSLSIMSFIVNLLSPLNNLITNQNQTFSCSANTSAALSNVTFSLWNSTAAEYNYLNNITGLFNQTNFSYNFTHEGNYSWNCLFKNNLNFQSLISSNFSLNYDITYSNITFTLPSSNGSWSSGIFRMFTNENSTCSYSLNNGFSNYTLNSSNGINFTWLNSTLNQNQSYNLSVSCNDSAGNSKREIINFFADLTKPLITSISPPNGESYTGQTTIIFNYSVSDNLNISNCNFILNNALNITDSAIANQSLNYNFTKTLSPNTYTWSVNCTDDAGNIGNSSTSSFTISAASSGCTYNCGGGGGGGGGNGGATKTTSNTYSVSAMQITEGYTAELVKNDKIIFQLATSQISSSSGAGDVQTNSPARVIQKFENHSIIINNIGNNSVNLTIMSEPITLILLVNQSKKINLTSPEYYDLFIKLEEIKNNKANLTIKNIKELINATQLLQNKSIATDGEKGNETSKNNSSDEEANNKEVYAPLKYSIALVILVVIAVILIKIFKKKVK